MLFIEVHSAHTSDVGEVLEKLETLELWLKGHGALGKLRRRYVWVASGPTRIPGHLREARLLAPRGIPLPKKRILLDEYLE